MFKKRNYLVTLVRTAQPGSSEEVEVKPVYVEARNEGNAKYKAIVQTPGLWSVHSVKAVRRV